MKHLVPVILITLWMACLQCFGLTPRTDIAQYAHIPWRVGERGLEAPPQSIAQTKDGYIWVGTKLQLYRFDGIRFAPVEEGEPYSPHAEDTRFLFVGSDGTLYISSRSFGVFRWKDGKLQHVGLNMNHPGPFAEDSSGVIWFLPGRFDEDISLCRITGVEEHCIPESEGGPRGPFTSLLLEQDGARWLGTESRLVHSMPNRDSRVFRLADKSRTSSKAIVAIAKGSNGTIWAGLENEGGNEGLVYLRQNKLEDYVSPALDGRRLRVHCLFTDSAGSLWIGTADDGLYRIIGSRTDHFSTKDGLTGDTVKQIFEDHEGSIWIVTPQGLDQFYELPVLTFGQNQGLAGGPIHAVAATAKSDEVWAGALNGLYIIDAKGSRPVRHLTIPAIGSIEDLYRDVTGTMWVAGETRLAFYENNQFHLVKYKGNTDIGRVVELSEDSSGDLWVITLSSEYGSALNHIRNGVIPERYYWPRALGQDTMSSISAHPGEGLWLCTVSGQLYWFHKGEFQRLLSGGAGFGLSPDREGSWAYPAAEPNDLMRLQDGEMRLLKLHMGTERNTVLNLISDENGSLWLYTASGLMQVQISDIKGWWNSKTGQVPWRLFGFSDGAVSGISTSRPAVSEDGQVWFSNGQNLQEIDPKHIPENKVAPPVHIETFASDGQQYPLTGGSTLALHPNVKNLEIQYTAPSFVKPDKVEFKYRLIGLSPNWMIAGSRRDATYNDLKPGNYIFQVIATNSDGVWNSTGDSLAFSIAPAWYQTILFRISCFFAGLFLLWFIFYLRIKQASRSLRARLDERIAERTRLARDLHDTLLQTLQGSKLVADDALEHRTDAEYTHRSLEKLSGWIDRAMREGRAALNALHAGTPDDRELSKRLQSALDEPELNSVPERFVTISGTPLQMDPTITDEICRVGYEAIRNASKHSCASRIEVQLAYSNDFTLIVRDNGRGMDSTVASKGRDGHYGLQSMRERAARIDAQLQLITAPNLGTTIELKLAGKLAFGQRSSAWSKLRSWLR